MNLKEYRKTMKIDTKNITNNLPIVSNENGTEHQKNTTKKGYVGSRIGKYD